MGGAQGPLRDRFDVAGRLLLMNPAELRPSGGLIGNLGTVTFSNGQPEPFQLKDYGYFDSRLKQCIQVPSPLRYYLTFFRNCLDIGDAEFWEYDTGEEAERKRHLSDAIGLGQ